MVLLMQETERVDNEDLKNYVEAYLRKYKEVVEDNLNLVDDIEHVFFKYCWYLIIDFSSRTLKSCSSNPYFSKKGSGIQFSLKLFF